VRLVHSTVHWRLRCIVDTATTRTRPPTWRTAPRSTAPPSPEAPSRRKATPTRQELRPRRGFRPARPSSGCRRRSPTRRQARHTWTSPTRRQARQHVDVNNPPPSSPEVLRPRSPTTSSPVLLSTPPRSPLVPTSRSVTARSRRQTRRTASAPYSRLRTPAEQGAGVVIAHQGRRFATTNEVLRPSRASEPGDEFALARWPCGVAHLRDQFNPLATLFPSVPSFGWCTCSSPCRTDTCRNAKMNVYCSRNCCPKESAATVS